MEAEGRSLNLTGARPAVEPALLSHVFVWVLWLMGYASWLLVCVVVCLALSFWRVAKAASCTEKLSALINIDGESVCIGKASASRLFILSGTVAGSDSVIEVHG